MFGEKAPTGNLALVFTDDQSSTEVRHLPSFSFSSFLFSFLLSLFCFVLVLLFSNVSFQLWEHDPRVMMRPLGLHNEVFRTWIDNTVNSFEYCLPVSTVLSGGALEPKDIIANREAIKRADGQFTSAGM